jgi:hypothetical protein
MFHSWKDEIFLFFRAFRLALGSTQTLTKWVPGVLSLEVMQSVKLTTQPPSTAKVKNGGAIPLLPTYVSTPSILI